MKSLTILSSALILAMAAANEDKPHLSSVGPARDLGIVLENCESFSCSFGDDEYRVCYYGIPFISEPQEVCWRNTPFVTPLPILSVSSAASNADSALEYIGLHSGLRL